MDGAHLRRLATVVVLAILAAGCGNTAAISPSAATGTATPSAAEPSAPPGSVASPAVPVRLPEGFPVLPGAIPLALPPDDPGLIARWSSDQQGSAAYDFYVDALPAAGYPIAGLYPGGGGAIIRFTVPGGAIWQMVAGDGGDGTVVVEIRLDRP